MFRALLARPQSPANSSYKKRPVHRTVHVWIDRHATSQEGVDHARMFETNPPGPNLLREAARRQRQLLKRLESDEGSSASAQAMRVFGEAVGRLRRTRHLTRAQVAEQCNLLETEIAMVEWGLLEAAEVEDRLEELARGCQMPDRVLKRVYSGCVSHTASVQSKGEAAGQPIEPDGKAADDL